MTIYFIENLLPKTVIKGMKSEMLGTWFPWYFFDKSIPKDTIKKQCKTDYVPTSIFRHRFYDNYNVCSNWNKIVDDVVSHLCLKLKKKIEVKAAYANLLNVAGKENTYDIPHVDRTDDKETAMTGIFFFNTTNSKTCIYKETHQVSENNFNGAAVNKQLTPSDFVDTKENCFVYFNCRSYHSAPAWSNKPRLVLNINFNIVEY